MSAEGTPHISRDTEGRRPELREDELERTLDQIVQKGRPRLYRTTPELFASGAIAGVEISLGVLAFLAVEEATGSKLLAGVAFSVGFIALLLGNSELFTEGFLVPVTVVAAKEATYPRLVRFWLVTLAGNLVGGWATMWMVVTAFPALRATAIKDGATFATAELSLPTFLLAVLAGLTMTLLTRMRNGTDNDVAKVDRLDRGGVPRRGPVDVPLGARYPVHLRWHLRRGAVPLRELDRLLRVDGAGQHDRRDRDHDVLAARTQPRTARRVARDGGAQPGHRNRLSRHARLPPLVPRTRRRFGASWSTRRSMAWIGRPSFWSADGFSGRRAVSVLGAWSSRVPPSGGRTRSDMSQRMRGDGVQQ
jgi:hypothetical protein